jgi:hypothetical protein
MSRGSKVFRATDLPESNSSGYPAPFRDGQHKRWNRRLGDHGGLKNYGVRGNRPLMSESGSIVGGAKKGNRNEPQFFDTGCSCQSVM